MNGKRRNRILRRVAAAVGVAAFLFAAASERVATADDFPVFSTVAFDGGANGGDFNENANGAKNADFNDGETNAARRSARSSERVLFARLGSDAQTAPQNRVKTPILTSKNAPENGESANGADKESGETAANAPKTSFVGAVVSAVGALTLVLGVFLAGVFLLKTLAPSRFSGAGGATELIESSPIGGKFELLTIRWGKKLILAARSADKIAPLSETSDPAEIAEILDAAARRKGNGVGGGSGAFGRANWAAALKTLKSGKTAKAIFVAAALGGAFWSGEVRAVASPQAQADARAAVDAVSNAPIPSAASRSGNDKSDKNDKNEKVGTNGSGETGTVAGSNGGSASLGVGSGEFDWIAPTGTGTENVADSANGEKNNDNNGNDDGAKNGVETDSEAGAASNLLANGPSALFEPNGWLGPSGISASLKTALTLSILTLAPAILLMTTSFVRLSVVLALLRQALGAGQVPSHQTTTALAIFLTLLIMAPVWTDVYNDAVAPYSNGEIDAAAAFERGQAPIRTFLARQIEKTGNTDAIWLFMRYIPDAETPKYFEDVPWRALAPAFLLSELKTAFLIGFQIFIPFLIIDIVVSCVLVSTGMMMLPPAVVSLPLKLALFVLTDGWTLVVKSLLESFAWSAGG